MQRIVFLALMIPWVCYGVTYAASSDWISMGPYGGSVWTIVIDPEDPSIVYAGTDGGVFRSMDGGLNWKATNGGLPRFPIYRAYAIAINPSDPNVLYAGIVFTRGVAGIFRSNDRGGHWDEIRSQPTTEKRYELRSIVIDPSNPRVMYAAMEGGGVFKSTDGGESWKEMNQGLDKRVEVLAIDPDQPQLVYAGTAIGMLKTTAGGLTWKSTGLTGVAAVRCIALDPTNAQVVYAGTVRGVYKSTDRGESWEEMNEGLDNLYVRAMAIDPEDPQTVYIGTDENIHEGLRGKVYKSIDGGESWTAVGTDLTKFGISAVSVNPIDAQIVYAGSSVEEGIFRSTDGGATWAKANQGLTNIAVFSIAIDPTNPQVMYASAEFTGVYKSTDGGIHWSQINNGLKGIRHYRLTIDPSNPQCLYVVNRDGLYKSINGGESWTQISTAYSFRIDPQDPQHIYAEARGGILIETTNGGETWREVGSRSRPGGLAAIDPRDPHTLYFARRSTVFKSTDGGLTWTSAELPRSSAWIWPAWLGSLVTIDPSDPETIYAGGGFLLAKSEGGLFKSMDGGASWRGIEEGLTNIDILDIRIDLRDSQVLYAATGNGLFISPNGGERWEEVNTGQALRVFFSVADPQNPDIVYLGTDAKGAFKGVIHTGLTGVEEETKEERPWTFRLYPSYPNPFNSETTIRYESPTAGEVSLGIYNLKGQLVRALIDDKQTEGHHSVRWDGRDDGGDPVSSGIYIYRLKARNGVKARKMLVLR